MAKYDDIGNGSLGSFGDIIKGMAVNMAITTVRGLVTELTSANIGNFNQMNHDFMTIHMMRNAYEKIITLNTVGENSYANGNADMTATPALYPSYTRGNNYMEFVTDAHDGSVRGEMVTRVQKAGEENRNLYLDYEGKNGDTITPNFTGKYTDKNSILFKTKRLMRQNKLKTIISQFHTTGVAYNGQIGTSEFGESHGRNLLTKDAAMGRSVEKHNNYDDPYCRVWTHHYKYDSLAKTIRGGVDGEGDNFLNVWDNFFWNESDGHEEDNTKYIKDGEKYDYAWRSKHNQERRRMNSVLDPKQTGTNLVNITPKYLSGRGSNVHTKSCMFSIENLAWKDYDPYSFEQALSWEQRGPFGGRIMWFPPYGLEIQETSTAKWNSSDFIGRGEPVYTYINSERSGSLSFLMLTDHPSSVDYASWWNDKSMVENTTGETLNAENDYLRYFAGCFNPAEGDNKGGKTGGLLIRPPHMTDEYIKLNPPLIDPEKQTIEKNERKNITKTNQTVIKFNVFYPNNYSGYDDLPTNRNSSVDAIMYLLFGHYTQKGNNDDIPLNENTTPSAADLNGFEMNTDKSISDAYQQGDVKIVGAYGQYEYRVDKKYVNQKLKRNNYTDKNNYHLNFSLKQQQSVAKDDSYYTLAEVAAAYYKLNNKNGITNLLIGYGVDTNRVNTLYTLFDEQNLVSAECKGTATNQGSDNDTLSTNRGNTIVNWLKKISKWSNINQNITNNGAATIPLKDKTTVNSVEAKINRRTECTLTFTKVETTTETVTKTTEIPDGYNNEYYPHYKGFRWKNQELQPDGTIWNYYEQEQTVNYYEQSARPNDNYDSGSATDTPVSVSQLIEIFNNQPFMPEKHSCVKENEKYRGTYQTCGFYIKTHNYNEDDNVTIIDFPASGEVLTFDQGDYLRYYNWNIGSDTDINGVFYANEEYHEIYYPDWVFNMLADGIITKVFNQKEYYKQGDIVLNTDGKFYECQVDFKEKYYSEVQDETPVIEFDTEDWKVIEEEDEYAYFFGWELTAVINKVSELLCITPEEFIQDGLGISEGNYRTENNDKYSCIWKYGTTKELDSQISDTTDFARLSQTLEPGSRPDSTTENPPIKYTGNENDYLGIMVNTQKTSLSLENIHTYIILYRLLDCIKRVDVGDKIQDACSAQLPEEYLKEKRLTSINECNTNIWIDRGDHLLIQECYVNKKDSNVTDGTERNRQNELNKLRYDQEYRFYEQYKIDHPLMFEKLQEKLKYFNPAFHSMTPEGFNARCTFLQQCTRQGNTKTMSDKNGRTANNLAFGRPPYCVLRLGDFYYQMIVIDNITFDYNVSDGLQWDLNPEGNGVQPMLCKVNISFKFIGGGDITGPVQRLQNAMSFNYYANTSFYDNRADRVEYQDTNWSTMGGAGNDKIDTKKSYAYLAKNYDNTPNIIKPVYNIDS